MKAAAKKMKRLVRRVLCGEAALFLACCFAPGAMAVTADEEAARIAGLEAVEPVQQEAVAVQPLIEIEKTWDIEDTHTAAVTPLVASMSFCRGEMGAEEESRTFYASVGTKMTEWPELSMTACGADGLSVAWVDDYAWDDPQTAVSSGTAYSLIAWTDTEYEYIHVVFTGLPMVILNTGDGKFPGNEYGPALVQVTSGGYDAVSSVAQVHRRGGASLHAKKDSYRIEFAEKKTKKVGYKKRRVSLLGMPEDTDWILLANPVDETHVHNYMAFQFWTAVNADAPAFNMLESRMVEVCLNGEYLGIYQLIQRIKPQTELEKMGFSKEDMAARLISDFTIEERPVIRFDGKVLELRYQPEGKTAEECFAQYDDCVKLMDSTTDGETFRQLALSRLDTRSVMRFFLFHQSVVIDIDNIVNNVYIWAVKKEGKLQYYFSPWDMDRSFLSENLKAVYINDQLVIPVRMLDLNLPGARETLWEEWNLQRSGPLSDDAVGSMMSSLEEEMNSTGAWQRDAARWNEQNSALDLSNIRDEVIYHLSYLEETMRERWPLDP